MNALWRRCVMILVAVLLLGGMSPALVAAAQTSTATSDTHTADVTRTIQQLAALERQGNINALYDMLHPDVREHLSREGLAAFYASPVALIPDGAAKVTEVTFATWTWPITGKSYKDAATVTYTVTGKQNGQDATETATEHLVLDGVNWRWFFGTSTDFVAAQNNTAKKDDTYRSPFPDNGYAAIDTYWADTFAIAGIAYTSPRDIIAVTGPITTGCGHEDTPGIDKALVYYCTADRTIYYSPTGRADVRREFGDYAWYHIVAHEWGHHIQRLLGIDATRDPELDGGIYPIELELQADCLAGTYDQDALAKGIITTDQVGQGLAITNIAGDRKTTKWDDPNAHGTDAQRRQSVLTGFDDGFIGCNVQFAKPEG